MPPVSIIASSYTINTSLAHKKSLTSEEKKQFFKNWLRINTRVIKIQTTKPGEGATAPVWIFPASCLCEPLAEMLCAALQRWSRGSSSVERCEGQSRLTAAEAPQEREKGLARSSLQRNSASKRNTYKHYIICLKLLKLRRTEIETRHWQLVHKFSIYKFSKLRNRIMTFARMQDWQN